MPVPKFGQLVEYVTEGPVIHQINIGQHDLANPYTSESVKADYEYVSGLRPLMNLSTAEVDSVKAELSGYHSDVIAFVTQDQNPKNVVSGIVFTQTRPEWKAGIAVKLDEVYLYKPLMNLYRCVQAHTTQVDWHPDITPALWTRFYDPQAGPPEWVQPTGAQDAYALGYKVTHKGHLWESLYAANVWEPGVFGWKDLGVYP